MKKAILFILGLSVNIFLACSSGTEGVKNQPESFPASDTHVTKLNINSTADSAGGGFEVVNPQDNNE